MKYSCAKCQAPIKKPDTHICRRCGQRFCGKHIYSRVDGNNGAITKNALEFCQQCVELKGGSLRD